MAAQLGHARVQGLLKVLIEESNKIIEFDEINILYSYLTH